MNEDGIKASELLSRKKGLREELCELNSVNIVNTSKQIKSGAISQEHLYCYSIYLGFFYAVGILPSPVAFADVRMTYVHLVFSLVNFCSSFKTHL